MSGTSLASAARIVSHRFPLLLAPLALLAVIALLGPGSSARADTYTGLYVTFQANHTFTITLADGTQVGTTSGAPTVIPGGTYQVFLNDTSGAIMQLDFSGPGVSINTNMTNGEDLAAAYVETFQTNSTYTVRDDSQQNSPVLTFATSSATVGSGSSSSSSSSSSPPTKTTSSGGGSPASTDIIGSASTTVPFRGTLLGVVSPTGRLVLDDGGKPVGSLKAGKYKVKVTDRSRKSGFNLQEIRKNGTTVTGSTFVGTRSVTVVLKAGQWFFYPSFLGKKTYFIVTA